MMTSKDIRRELKTTWPDLTQIWLTDPAYEVLPQKWLEAISEECVSSEPFRENVWDCDNFALIFHSTVQLYQYALILEGKIQSKYSWAVGECIGYGQGFMGRMTHSMNLAITDTGVVLIEPQDGVISTPGRRAEYTPFFVKF